MNPSPGRYRRNQNENRTKEKKDTAQRSQTERGKDGSQGRLQLDSSTAGAEDEPCAKGSEAPGEISSGENVGSLTCTMDRDIS